MISKRNGFTSLIISYSHRISSSLCFNGLLSSNSFVWRISSASIDLQTSQRLDQIADQIADLMNNQNPSYPKTTKTSHSFVHSLNSKLILFFFPKKSQLTTNPISIHIPHPHPYQTRIWFRTFHFFLFFSCLTLTSIPCPYHRTLSRVRSIFSRSVFSLFYFALFFARMGFVACVAPVPVQMSDRNFDMWVESLKWTCLNTWWKSNTLKSKLKNFKDFCFQLHLLSI